MNRILCLLFLTSDALRLQGTLRRVATDDSAETSTSNSTETGNDAPSNSTDNPTELTDSSSNTTLATVVTSSKLNPSLVFPIAMLLPLQQLAPADFVAQYCEPPLTTADVLSIGTTGARYSAAVAEQLELILPVNTTDVAPAANSTAVDILQPYGSCDSDSDCASLEKRSHCVSSVCRECTPETIQSDCPNVVIDSNTCVEETHFTCSECLQDSDCDSNGLCRWVFPQIDTVPMMPRRLCTACVGVPESSELFDVANCLWRCPLGTTFSDSGECVPFAGCAATQFTSSEDKHFFYSPGINTTDASCQECAVLGPIDDPNFCAVLATNHTGVLVGDLNNQNIGPVVPCNTFVCDAGFRLNTDHDQCMRCRYRSCPAGQFLDACEADSAGTCVDCENQVDANSTWVNLNRVPDLNITSPLSACLAVCLDGYWRDTTNSCVLCDYAEATMCRIGQVISECGPGSDPGFCVPCPPTGPNSYWTGSKCQEAQCSRIQCDPGTVLSGCGGESPGNCVACPAGLPNGATAWISGCNFRCSLDMYVNLTSNTCSTCDASALCQLGERLVGCGIDGISAGTCQNCPLLPMGFFYQLGSECTPIKCDPSECGIDQRLDSCGYGDPGSCVSCGPLSPGLDGFTRRDGMDCQPACKEDSFAVSLNSNNATGPLPLAAIMLITPLGGNGTSVELPAYAGESFTCKSCLDIGICSPGYYLSNCGADSNAGICEPCTNLEDGEYWTGGLDCETAQCSDISCNNDQVLVLCGAESTRGGFGPGDCVSCSAMATLPPNASGWTTDIQQGRTCVPVCQAGYIEENKTCTTA